MSIIWQFQGIYRFLSNFYPAKLKYEGLWFPTSENAYQASKTLDPLARKLFQTCTPSEAKKIGSQVLLRPLWNEIKLATMEEIVRLKFSDEGLQQMLTDTYPQKLVEGNHWGDQFWGVSFDKSENKWKGKNHLGKILMRIRSDLL
jgi:ribA/ribD-fused uncharacterized protein